MYILGIESSCDETAVSISKDGTQILSSVVSTQIEEHKKYGGVVPEIASRRHCENILGVVREAVAQSGITLEQVDAIAVTYAPGLIGALLVGVSFAKGLAMATGKPLVPVHHIAGHIATNYISHPDLKPPYLCLVASGGHSHIVEVLDYTKFRIVGRTRDDAAGECFDKTARAMGFPYPGGVHIDNASGVCGRLLCCLKYEDEAYKEVKKKFPKIGSFIRYEDKQCKVVGLNVISDLVKIDNEGSILFIPLSDVDKKPAPKREKHILEELAPKKEKKHEKPKQKKPRQQHKPKQNNQKPRNIKGNNPKGKKDERRN